MKYEKIVDNQYKDKVGFVKIGAQSVQLCDHIEIVNGLYHVSALYTEELDTPKLREMGAETKKMYNGTRVAYLSQDMLKDAKPLYQDGMTTDLIDRLTKAMIHLNANRAAA